MIYACVPGSFCNTDMFQVNHLTSTSGEIAVLSNFRYLNMAMQKFESTIVVPTNFVFFTLSAIIAGIVFYKEFWGMTALEIFMFLFG